MELFAIIGVAVIVFVLFALKSAGGKAKGKSFPITAKKSILTKNEQPMFFRLNESLPECIVLAQVSFSALITSKGYAERARFNRKMADFVVCNKAFEVIAVVELDDSSHKGNEEKDEARDGLLKQAGVAVLRYKTVPNIDTVKADFAAISA